MVRGFCGQLRPSRIGVTSQELPFHGKSCVVAARPCSLAVVATVAGRRMPNTNPVKASVGTVAVDALAADGCGVLQRLLAVGLCDLKQGENASVSNEFSKRIKVMRCCIRANDF